MPEIENKKIPLPDKEEGANKTIEAIEKTKTTDEAKELFKQAKNRLLNINNWNEICGKASAIFKLTDENGNETEDEPKIGYYFKINIPAPKTETGEGFDWVKVEAIEENKNAEADSEFLLIRVRPSANPLNKDDNVAHFFSEKATSNFIVYREKHKVIAAVAGRNEIANTDDNDTILDKLRNAIVGTGAVGGLSNPQWKSLVNGLLGKK